MARAKMNPMSFESKLGKAKSKTFERSTCYPGNNSDRELGMRIKSPKVSGNVRGKLDHVHDNFVETNAFGALVTHARMLKRKDY